jgi:hypothetical protein
MSSFSFGATSARISRNCSRTASRSSTISWARTGSGRLSESSRLSSRNQKMSRLALSRFNAFFVSPG